MTGNNVTARYVQVSFLECSPEGINVDEIGIYDDPQAVATPEPAAWREDASDWIVSSLPVGPMCTNVARLI